MLKILTALALLATPAAAASPAVGVWSTPQEHGVVEVTDCGPGICGRVVNGDHIRANPTVTDLMNKNTALRGRPLKGLLIFEGLTGGPPKWRGHVYNPVDGGIYSGYVVQHGPDALVLTGCIIWPLCQSQRWTRVR